MRGHIRSRGPETHQLIWYVGRGPDGKPKYKSCTFHGSRREAENKLATIIASLSAGEYVEPTKETVGQYLMRWLAEIKPSLREKTYRWYEMNCRLYLIPEIGYIPLSKLSPLQIQTMYRRLLETGRTSDTATGKKGEGLSAAAVRGVHRTLNRALNQAVRWHILAHNPAQAVEQPRLERKEKNTLTPAEATRLLELAKPTGRYSLYLAALATGMRQGELLGLRWEDVDLDQGIAYVRQQLIDAGNVKKGEPPRFGPPKTKQGVRAVTLPKSLVQALREDWEKEKKYRTLPGYQDYGLVWHVLNGRPISPRNLDRQLKQLLDKAGLPDIRFHDLRHTHATLLRAAGADPKTVQERLGHSSISITLDLYTHWVSTSQVNAAESIDKVLFGYQENAQNPNDKTGS